MTWPIDPNPSTYDYLNDLEASDQIHHYGKIDELYSIVRGKLRLTCPFKWEDKYENPLFRADLTNQDGIPVPLREAGRKFYCKSWTLGEESVAMWKLYGCQGKGVRVTVKSSDLLFQAQKAYDITKNEAVYTKIGKVRYLDEAKLRKKYEPVDEFLRRFGKPNSEGSFESLLFKLKEYSTENEVRLISHDFDGRFGCSEEMEMSVDGCDLIEHVIFGPKVDRDAYEIHRNRLDELGLLKEKIGLSQLCGKLQYPIDLRKLRP